MICVIEARLPLPQSHLPLARLGPSGVPLASEPWLVSVVRYLVKSVSNLYVQKASDRR